MGRLLSDGRLSRRFALAGVGGLLALGGFLAVRKSDNGGTHSPYFQKLSQALLTAKLAHPVLVIDRPRLSSNIAKLRRASEAAKIPVRIVAKSLPSPDLLRMIMQGMGTDRLMLFSAAMLEQILLIMPQADVLMGKPLPALEFASIAGRLSDEQLARIQWLIDTPERLGAFLAAAQGRNFAVNFEVDVGLHRGGFATPDLLAEALRAAKQAPNIRLAGLMGYDPHVPKMSDPEAAFAESQALFKGFRTAFLAASGASAATATFNMGGSPTFTRHCKATLANEIAVGSAFVKPGDFDLPGLADLEPAAFIATPVIKASGPLRLPGNEWLSRPLNLYDPNTANSWFIHGGHWLAKPVSPQGLQYSGLYGRSSNQEMLTGSKSVRLSPGDYVFLRPDQSEALFLQFGDLVVYDGNEIAGRWPTLGISA